MCRFFILIFKKLHVIINIIMKIKILLYISIITLVYPSITNASINKVLKAENKDAYLLCKKSALTHKEKSMESALKEYVKSSEKITNKAKNEFDKISWYIDSSYRIHSQKIQNDKKQAMIPVNRKITDMRASAINTWKAEDSLCEHFYNNATTTIKSNKH